MAVTRYVSMNGRIRGETASGTRTDYLTDALGSVTGTVNGKAELVNAYRYKPYGARLSKSGSGTDPRYQWTGDTGSRSTNLNRAEQYVTLRHYGGQQAQWTTMPLRFDFGWAAPQVHSQGSLIKAQRVEGWLRQKYNRCGNATFTMTWKFNRSQKPVDGAIVQWITLSVQRFDCTGKQVYNQRNSYLEAWDVQNKPGDPGYVILPGSTDTFSFQGGTGCTFGTATWDARVSFYPGLKTTMPPWTIGSGHPSGILKHIDPANIFTVLSLGIEPPHQAHKMNVAHNCCVKPEGYRFFAQWDGNSPFEEHRHGGGPDPACGPNLFCIPRGFRV